MDWFFAFLGIWSAVFLICLLAYVVDCMAISLKKKEKELNIDK